MSVSVYLPAHLPTLELINNLDDDRLNTVSISKGGLSTVSSSPKKT